MINQINSNVNVFAPFKTDGVSYAITKPFTDEQKNEAEAHQERKHKALGYSLVVTGVVAGLSVLMFTKGLPKIIPVKFNSLLKYLSEKADKLKNSQKLSNLQKFYLPILEKAKLMSAYSNTVINTASIKDGLVKRFMRKIPILRNLEEIITNLFERISIRTSSVAYLKTSDKFNQFCNSISSIGHNNDSELQTKLNELKQLYANVFGEQVRNERLKQTKIDLNTIHDDFWKATGGNLKEYLKNKNTYNSFLSEDLAAEAKKALAQKVTPKKEEIDRAVKEILDICKNTMPEQEYIKLVKNSKNFTKSLNSSVDIELDKLFDKLRDLKIGSAPTDVLGFMGALGGVIWKLSNAENSDERNSVALKYGIPVVGASMVTLYSTIALVSGGASLVFGVASGVLLNKLGEFVDKKRKVYNETHNKNHSEVKIANSLSTGK